MGSGQQAAVRSSFGSLKVSAMNWVGAGGKHRVGGTIQPRAVPSAPLQSLGCVHVPIHAKVSGHVAILSWIPPGSGHMVTSSPKAHGHPQL